MFGLEEESNIFMTSILLVSFASSLVLLAAAVDRILSISSRRVCFGGPFRVMFLPMAEEQAVDRLTHFRVI